MFKKILTIRVFCFDHKSFLVQLVSKCTDSVSEKVSPRHGSDANLLLSPRVNPTGPDVDRH